MTIESQATDLAGPSPVGKNESSDVRIPANPLVRPGYTDWECVGRWELCGSIQQTE